MNFLALLLIIPSQETTILTHPLNYTSLFILFFPQQFFQIDVVHRLLG